MLIQCIIHTDIDIISIKQDSYAYMISVILSVTLQYRNIARVGQV